MNKTYLLIDAGGTQLKLGLMEGDLLVQQIQIPAHSEQGIRPALDLINGILHTWLAGAPVDGIGLALAGIVDHDECRVRSVNGKFEDAVAFDFPAWAEETFHCPIVMENDARAATIGEWKYGAGLGCDDLVMLTFGTGVGSSAIISGQILRGRHSQAGVLIGHFTIDRGGGRCNCGNIGCVESVASGWALPAALHRQPGFSESTISNEPILDFESLFRHARKGDQVSMTVRDQFIDAWSLAAVNAIHAYDPEVLLLGGGVMQGGDIIRESIQAHIDQYAWTPWGKVQVKTATLGNLAAIWGMKHLIDNWSGTIPDRSITRKTIETTNAIY
jgi:glucokinase